MEETKKQLKDKDLDGERVKLLKLCNHRNSYGQLCKDEKNKCTLCGKIID